MFQSSRIMTFATVLQVVLNIMQWLTAAFSYALNKKMGDTPDYTFLIFAGIHTAVIIGILLWDYWIRTRGDDQTAAIAVVVIANCLLMALELIPAAIDGLCEPALHAM
ncbi:MAG: hypothetical protein JW849_05050 [Phycisphaerae bacterium]|nr:hypothetical protein [Phycisphaerae bacterium]